jgi:hypothetical protein
MSTIQLSDELISEIQQVLVKNDPACQDAGIGIQYIAAITGFMLSQFPGEEQQKKEILNQLFGFANHVLTENAPKKEPANQGGDAFGIWKPE